LVLLFFNLFSTPETDRLMAKSTLIPYSPASLFQNFLDGLSSRWEGSRLFLLSAVPSTSDDQREAIFCFSCSFPPFWRPALAFYKENRPPPLLPTTAPSFAIPMAISLAFQTVFSPPFPPALGGEISNPSFPLFGRFLMFFPFWTPPRPPSLEVQESPF